MYIAKVELENIKCFGKAILNFEDEKGTPRGCVMLGDNGIGKTTILRAISMCLCGESSGSGLMDELEGEWIARGSESARIRIEFKSSKNGNGIWERSGKVFIIKIPLKTTRLKGLGGVLLNLLVEI
ncbi:MAG: AAA family ATPase [Candidatus Omnitrophica bacterium]|nr:AAA family ATPase [Candidatus Omnitrophota bacterium]